MREFHRFRLGLTKDQWDKLRDRIQGKEDFTRTIERILMEALNDEQSKQNN